MVKKFSYYERLKTVCACARVRYMGMVGGVFLTYGFNGQKTTIKFTWPHAPGGVTKKGASPPKWRGEGGTLRLGRLRAISHANRKTLEGGFDVHSRVFNRLRAKLREAIPVFIERHFVTRNSDCAEVAT